MGRSGLFNVIVINDRFMINAGEQWFVMSSACERLLMVHSSWSLIMVHTV